MPESGQLAPDPNYNEVPIYYTTKPQSASTINAVMDLSYQDLGKDNPGEWTIRVCAQSSLSDCKNAKNTVGETLVTVTEPTDLPTITHVGPTEDSPTNTCLYQFGQSFTVTFAPGQPNTNYYWWVASGTPMFIAKSDSQGSSMTFTLSDENGRYGKYALLGPGISQLCVDSQRTLFGIKGGRKTNQNCTTITLTASPPDSTSGTTCDFSAATSSDGTGNDSGITTGTYDNIQDAEKVTSLPPCKEWIDSSNGGSLKPDEVLARINAANKSGATDDVKLLAADVQCTQEDTAVGPISTDAAGFVQSIFKIVLGLAGGIALILIIVSGYRYMASQGNPEAVKAATEQLTSAIIGLLFIIFSFVILQMVGVDILQIPGFGK
jgi:hypothetical protein